MATTQESAIFSLYAYSSSEANTLALPSQWVKEKDRTEGTGGFAYAVFRNTSTNEVVIAYRGTDDVADMLTNTGLTISQERQAAVIAAQYINQYGSGNVSFTGHSMGGGLAATMAVWFNRPATVFDPAPTQAVATDLAVVNSVIGLIGSVSAPQSILDYAATSTTQFASREANVTSYYAPGSAVRAISTDANTITGQGNALQFGVSKMEVADQLYYLHTQALLTAGILAPQSFPQTTVAVQWALPMVFDKTLYNLPEGSDKPNFLINIIRSEQQNAGNGKLTHFAADLNKLGTNLAGLNDAAQKAIIAQGIEWYYWQGTDYAGQEFFTQTGTLLQYGSAIGDNLVSAQNKAASYVEKWLAPIANNSGEFYFPSFGTKQQWTVATSNTTGVTATARDADKSQMFVGNGGDANFTGGHRSDVILAGDGADTLNGGAGNDMLYGGSGTDTYTFSGQFGNDTILDTDGLGQIKFGSTTLTGGKKLGSGTWQSDDKTTLYTQIGSNLIISTRPGNTASGSITIKNFISGQLGLTLDDQAAPADTAPTAQTNFDLSTAVGRAEFSYASTAVATDSLWVHDAATAYNAGTASNPTWISTKYVPTGSGADVIEGGASNAVSNVLYSAGAGNDRIYAGTTVSLTDAIARGDDPNTVGLASSHYVLDGGAGDDQIIGSDARDVLFGGAGDDPENEVVASDQRVTIQFIVSCANPIMERGRFNVRSRASNDTSWRTVA